MFSWKFGRSSQPMLHFPQPPWKMNHHSVKIDGNQVATTVSKCLHREQGERERERNRALTVDSDVFENPMSTHRAKNVEDQSTLVFTCIRWWDGRGKRKRGGLKFTRTLRGALLVRNVVHFSQARIGMQFNNARSSSCRQKSIPKAHTQHLSTTV